MMNHFLKIFLVGLLLLSCMNRSSDTGNDKPAFTGKAGEVRLIVLSPGHFHANLLQKRSLEQVNDTVYVYAAGEDAGLKQYLSAIESFNNRDDEPTNWETIIYIGDDFLERMVSDMKGNVVVLAGNNRDKTEYILAAVNAGLNVLSDKPMAISTGDFQLLEDAYNNALAKDVFLYDMMTER